MRRKKRVVKRAFKVVLPGIMVVSVMAGMTGFYYLGFNRGLERGRSEVHIRVKPIYLERQVVVPRCTTSQMADLLNAGAASCRAYLP